jgi:hypothetical protein
MMTSSTAQCIASASPSQNVQMAKKFKAKFVQLNALFKLSITPNIEQD